MIHARRAEGSRAFPTLLILLVTAVTFLPVVDHALLNWDDLDVLVRNPYVREAVFGWAFRTRYMEHYQPVSWLVWAGLGAWGGLSARAVHAASLVIHLVNTALVLVVFVRMPRSRRRRRIVLR